MTQRENGNKPMAKENLPRNPGQIAQLYMYDMHTEAEGVFPLFCDFTATNCKHQ